MHNQNADDSEGLQTNIVFILRTFVAIYSLMVSYWRETIERYRRATAYVDRIFKRGPLWVTSNQFATVALMSAFLESDQIAAPH